ncbi:hypothetical protein Tco_0750768 [Tanacetum coccineum]|uniref:Myb/SANT-like domain-containing protein n=1 Tax=Tanacetum coccineum TaxID=301880 RepID=A0ABQ4Z2Z4_9ASTR
MDHTTQSSPISGDAQLWHQTQLLIEALQDMASDPSWKTDGGFRSNYLCEAKFHVNNDMLKYSECQWNNVEKMVACEKDWYDGYCKTHKEGKGMWDSKFPFFNELELVYGKDRATDDAQTVPSASNTSNAKNVGGKQNNTVSGDKVAKKRRTSSSQDQDVEACREGIDHKLVRLKIPTLSLLDAADIFSTNNEKMDVILNLSDELRITYIMKLMGFGFPRILVSVNLAFISNDALNNILQWCDNLSEKAQLEEQNFLDSFVEDKFRLENDFFVPTDEPEDGKVQ